MKRKLKSRRIVVDGSSVGPTAEEQEGEASTLTAKQDSAVAHVVKRRKAQTAITEHQPVDGVCAVEAEIPATGAPVKKARTPGVVWLGYIPRQMGPDKVRQLLSQHGALGRVFLKPEDKTITRRRKRELGNGRPKFLEGWVEFLDKRIAKRTARALNGQLLGGKKRRNIYRDEMWNMKYLSKFTWSDINADNVYAGRVRKARLDQKMSQARREQDFYVEKSMVYNNRRKRDERKGADLEQARMKVGPERTRRVKPELLPRGEREIPTRVLSMLF